MRLVVEAPDGRVLERAVHAFDLTVGPGMAWLGQAMVDVVLRAGILEGMRTERLVVVHGAADLGCGRADVPGRDEVRAVVGQHGVDPVGHGLDECAQEVTGDAARGFLVQLDKGELGCTVDGNQKVEPALCRVDLGDVDVELAERVGLELATDRGGALDLWQLGDVVSLEAAMQ